jgi:hypothetical protein
MKLVFLFCKLQHSIGIWINVESLWFRVGGLGWTLEGHCILSFENMVYDFSLWNKNERICLVIKFGGWKCSQACCTFKFNISKTYSISMDFWLCKNILQFTTSSYKACHLFVNISFLNLKFWILVKFCSTSLQGALSSSNFQILSNCCFVICLLES